MNQLKHVLISVLLIASCTHTAPQEWADCQFMDEKTEEMVDHKACGIINTRALVFSSDFLQKIPATKRPSCIQVKTGTNGKWQPYYVLPSGLNQATLPYDNGCDYFAEGLARTKSDSGFAYFDESLKLVLKTNYEWAYPFDGGKAKVCRNVEWKTQGESQAMTRGECATINKKGEVTSPFQKVIPK